MFLSSTASKSKRYICSIQIYTTSFNRDRVGDLYKRYVTRYEETFIREAKKVILEEAGTYNASTYWVSNSFFIHGQQYRNRVGVELLDHLNKTFRANFATYSQQTNTEFRCEGLQLLQIDLPATFEESIVLTQVEVQTKETKQHEQVAAQIREAINVDISEANRQITVVRSQANATAIQYVQNAQATTINNTITYEKVAYDDVAKTLGITPQTGLLDYIYYLNMMGLKDSTLLIGLQNSIVNIAS